MPRKLSYEEAKVRIQHLMHRRNILELERDGNLKFYEAAVMANDGPKCDDLRQKLHDALDSYLDTVTEIYSLTRVAE
jgi:hypothetical protein